MIYLYRDRFKILLAAQIVNYLSNCALCTNVKNSQSYMIISTTCYQRRSSVYTCDPYMYRRLCGARWRHQYGLPRGLPWGLPWGLPRRLVGACMRKLRAILVFWMAALTLTRSSTSPQRVEGGLSTRFRTAGLI